MTDERVAIKRHPLPRILIAVLAKPLALFCTVFDRRIRADDARRKGGSGGCPIIMGDPLRRRRKASCCAGLSERISVIIFSRVASDITHPLGDNVHA